MLESFNLLSYIIVGIMSLGIVILGVRVEFKEIVEDIKAIREISKKGVSVNEMDSNSKGLKVSSESSKSEKSEEEVVTQVKRPRGRPKKIKTEEEVVKAIKVKDDLKVESDVVQTTVKRPRGRPKKVKVEEEVISSVKDREIVENTDSLTDSSIVEKKDKSKGSRFSLRRNKKDESGSLLKVVDRTKDYVIYVDKDSNVMYVGNKKGITVMVDHKGKPKLYNK